MTREQLDAIRARAAELGTCMTETTLLLAEVERLTTDIDLLKSLKHGWKVLTEKAISERDAAFQRGVAAMREAAIDRAHSHSILTTCTKEVLS